MRYDLTLENIHKLNAAIKKPSYNPKELTPCIAHLGVGNFFRSHLADYTQDAIDEHWEKNNCALSWGIQAIDLRTSKITDALSKQDNLYLLNKRDNDGLERKIIASITSSCFSSNNPEKCLEILTAAETRILTLTITEKGYYYNANTKQLNIDSKEIQQDLIHWKKHATDWPNQCHPQTALGWITAACILRKERDIAPLIIISCDNLLQNGKTIQQAVYQFMRNNDPDLAEWFLRHVCCLSSMVDRITPAISQQVRDNYSKQSNLTDGTPVVCEPFKQWVIEKPKQEELLGVMPKWEQCGALWVDNVAPFEQVKLQILNALHSTLAYLGILCGHASIAECMRDPLLVAYARRCLADDILPTITPPEGLDLHEYSSSILDRFANVNLKHLTSQVGMDGSKKIPLRWAPTIEKNLSQGKLPLHLLLAVSAWSIYLRPDFVAPDKAQHWEVHDPLNSEFRHLAQSSGASLEGWIDALLSNHNIFPGAISCDISVNRHIMGVCQEIVSSGIQTYLKRHYST